MRLFLLLQTLHQGVPLRCLSLHLALAGGLGLRTLGVHLLLELPLTGLLGLGAVDLKTNMSVRSFPDGPVVGDL